MKDRANTDGKNWREQASEQYIRSSRNRRHQLRRMKKILTMFSLFLVLVISGLCGKGVVNSMAKESPAEPVSRYYTSVRVEEGDSLWSIAKEYGTNSGKSMSEYITELQQINHLAGDTIHAGNYLTVFYYR